MPPVFINIFHKREGKKEKRERKRKRERGEENAGARANNITILLVASFSLLSLYLSMGEIISIQFLFYPRISWQAATIEQADALFPCIPPTLFLSFAPNDSAERYLSGASI